MIKKLTVLFYLSLVVKTQCVQAQDITFAILRNDDQIGKINISRNQTDSEERIEISTVASFKVLWNTHHRSSDFEVIIKNNVLHYSLMKTILNDELDKKTETKWQNGKYLCIEHPDDTHTIEEKIRFCSSQLYFQEPKQVKEVYSESYLTMCPVEKQENGSYKLSLPGGKDNYYTYQNGILKEVLVDRTWFDIIFKRME